MMNLNTPLVSIISVTYNVDEQISVTIESILKLKTSEVEYIIIDGNSSDRTLDIIDRYKEKIDVVVSETDKGIYDAMNKGIRIAKGKFICFINNGDILMDIPIKELKDEADADVVCFPVSLSNSEVIYPEYNWMIKIKNGLPHQGCFYKRSTIAFYNLKFKIFSDFDMNQNAYKEGKKIIVKSSPIIALHDINGVSYSKVNSKEIFAVVNDNFGLVFKILSFLYFKSQGLLKRLENFK